MQAFRKFGGSRVMQLAATWNKPVITQSMKYRDLTFKPEEFTGAHDDDYHRSEEDIRQRKTMRANFMRIQSLPENAYEKYVLQQMLSKNNPNPNPSSPPRQRYVSVLSITFFSRRK